MYTDLTLNFGGYTRNVLYLQIDSKSVHIDFIGYISNNSYIPSSTCPQDSQNILIISRRQLQPSAPSLGRLSTEGDGRFWASPAGLMSILTFSCPGLIGYKK